jgi:cobalt-precorrin-6B (C15)-methyltransferase
MQQLLWDYCTPGIPDELFDRMDAVPITKEEVRTIVISKLRLKEGFSAIDIGCGSGSITVELCLQTKSKNIFAIDFKQEAIQLTNKNLKKFGVMAKTVLAKAEDVLPTLPQVNAIVIGGTWGNTTQILEMAIERLVKGGRIVIDTILIETMYVALGIINSVGLYDVDITQATISKARKVTTGTMMMARNPVTIISATRP